MTPAQRAVAYSKAFLDRPPLIHQDGWVTGTWLIGACYKNPNRLYGAYPHGYLERVHSMFPDAREVLHVFSGGLTKEHAQAEMYASQRRLFYTASECVSGRAELVDLHGPEQGRHPTWQGDVLAMPDEWAGRFDLVLADPPYSVEDAKRYDVKMPNRRDVTHAIRRVTKKGGNLVWLDTVWPMHRKGDWRCWGQIGLVRSTNHRVRLVSCFEAV